MKYIFPTLLFVTLLIPQMILAIPTGSVDFGQTGIETVNDEAGTPGTGSGGGTAPGTGSAGNTQSGTGSAGNTAEGSAQNVSVQLNPPLGSVTNLKDFIFKILDIIISIALPIATLFIVYSGFLFVKAQGNESEITEAKKAFFYAIIGTAVLLASKLAIGVIEATLNQLK